MKTFTSKMRLDEQKRLDEINASGRYSFNQTIDNNGHIHVDCDLDTYVRELGLISMEEHIKRLNQIENDHTN